MAALTPVLRALRRAVRAKHLILLLWGAHLAIAAIAAYPVLRHLDSTLSGAPAGDEFLRRLSLPLLSDLVRTGGLWSAGIGPLLSLVVVLTLTWNVLSAGGALETLLSNDPARMAQRFGRGAGRFFGRFLRMGFAAALTALVAIAALAGTVFAVSGGLDDSAEGAKLWLNFGGALVALSTLLLVLLALDLARVRVARDDVRKGVRVFFQTLRAVLRRPGQVLAIWIVLALGFAAISALYLGLRYLLPPTGGAALFALVLAQQLVMIARAGMRVALWSGEIALVDRRWPEAPLSERLAAGSKAG